MGRKKVRLLSSAISSNDFNAKYRPTLWLRFVRKLLHFFQGILGHFKELASALIQLPEHE